MYKKSWLTPLCNVVCWILTSAVHRFRWDSSWFESSHHCDIVSPSFWGLSHFLSDKVSPGWRLKPSFRTQKKCPFPLNKGVPSIEYNKYKDYVNIFRDQILCPSNGAVSKERFHCGQKIEPTLPPPPLIKDEELADNLAWTEHHSSGRKGGLLFILFSLIW